MPHTPFDVHRLCGLTLACLSLLCQFVLLVNSACVVGYPAANLEFHSHCAFFTDIHVEAENAGAQGMYKSLGYVLEKEEEEWLAERMGRPRRLLLRKHIGGSQAAHRA